MFELPAWLDPTRDLPQVDLRRRQKYERTRRYFTQLFLATPKWMTEEQKAAFYEVYRKARKMRDGGMDVQVDHIVPVIHDYVCGLNVPWNVEIVDRATNNRKSNKWWPDCPWETQTLPGIAAAGEPEQLGLPL